MKTDPLLVESISDFLIGVIDAGVETGAKDEDLYGTVNGYVQKSNLSRGEIEDIVERVSSFGSEMAQLFNVPAPSVAWAMIDEEDWGKNWKQHFKPFLIVPGLVISPTWEEYHPAPGEAVITMDPGMAFGTGHHATTSLCLECIRDSVTDSKGLQLLDVGTGTGILGMAALLFGAARVLGIDNDSEAVSAAKENVRKNELQNRMEVSLNPLSSLDKTFEVVVANIVHDVLVDMAEDLTRLTADGGTLILSGILNGQQVDNIITVFTTEGLNLLDQKNRQEWTALRFQKG